MSQVHQTGPRVADAPSARLEGVTQGLLERLRLLPPSEILAILKHIDPALLKAALQPEAPISEGKSNRRRSPRNRTLRSGKIIYNNQQSVLDCLIRDVSSTGCRIRVANPGMVPNHFTLMVIGTSEKYDCDIRWRTAQELGVKFVR